MTEVAESVSGITPDPGYRVRYPWHEDTWARLTHDLSALPHALLLHGSTGLGKRAFAWRLAQSALCIASGAQAQACGQSAEMKNREQLHKDIEALGRGADDPLRCAARWKSFGMESSLSWFQDYLARVIRRQMQDGKFNPKVRGLFTYLDLLSEAK